MEEVDRDESVDLSVDRFVQLHYSRRWPKFVAEWAVKQRAGESDFPVADGVVERLPDPQDTPEQTWQRVRDQALQEASSASVEAPAAGRRSLLSRLFGRH